VSNVELESAEMALLREELPSGKKADKNKMKWERNKRRYVKIGK